MKLRICPIGVRQWTMALGRLLLLTAFVVSSVFALTRMPGSSFHGPLPVLTSEELKSGDILERHVYALAQDIGPRNIWSPPSMVNTVSYLETVFADVGYTVVKQDYEVEKVVSTNLEVEIQGQDKADEIVVLGAHYDTIMNCPGANDNGSGVAVLLELARLLHSSTPERTIRFVAFANEEPPFFLNDTMGSRQYAIRARDQGENIVAMVSLETMGFYSDISGSQKYPFPFSYFYPDTANFIAIVGNLHSRKLVKKSIAAFRKYGRVPSEALAAPQFVTGIGWSDHWSFWQEGVKAIMITDTAFYRYDAYHTPSDTYEKLDYERMARVVHGLIPTVLQLAKVDL